MDYSLITNKVSSNKFINKTNIMILVIIILISIAVYYLTKSGITHNKIDRNVLHLTDDFGLAYSANLMPKSKTGIKYTFSFWIYINNVPGNAHWKQDFTRPKGVLAHSHAPTVYYLANLGILQISMGFKDNNNVLETYKFDLNSVKLQKWENIVIVADGSFVEIYLNGQFHKAMDLGNIHFISNKMLYVGQPNNNFNGYLAYIEYFNDALKEKDIAKLYRKNKIRNVFSRKLENYSEYHYKKYSENK